MLVLTRGVSQEIVISGNIRLVVLQTESGRVRIGVSAPPSISVDRAEVHQRRGLQGAETREALAVK